MQIVISNTPAKAVCGNITDRVKTFEDACEVLGFTGDILNGSLNDGLLEVSEKITAHIKLMVIVKALNQGWKPNWNNSSEYKYYPYWSMDGGFSLYLVLCCYQLTRVPSCLCFKTRELAVYATKQFADLYKIYFTN